MAIITASWLALIEIYSSEHTTSDIDCNDSLVAGPRGLRDPLLSCEVLKYVTRREDSFSPLCPVLRAYKI
jgi:hypothetical protein